MTTSHGTHDHADDPRNREILISVNGQFLRREEAVVSIFDSGFLLGDGVWEGLRVKDGHPAFLEQHLDRLFEGAAAIALDITMTREALTEQALSDPRRQRHARRRGAYPSDGHEGTEVDADQDPRMSAGPPTVVIVAEHKDPLPSTLELGISLFTVHVRRASPDTLDPKINSHSKLNDITACIQAFTAGADEALMLDPHGFVATCNSTHFFVVRKDEVWTSTGDYCLGGITRRTCCGSALRPASWLASETSVSPTSTERMRHS